MYIEDSQEQHNHCPS